MKTKRHIASILLILVLLFSLAACSAKQPAADNNANADADIWADAKYSTDTELGSGSKTVVVTVKVEEKSVTFTLHTDKETVGEALLEQALIDGDQGDYGLYVKKVNGILADYDVDQTYWAFYIDGDFAISGVDMTEIDEGAVYSLERTK